MFRLISFIFIIMCSFLYSASDRSNDKQLSFLEISPSITKARGWSKNQSLGKWISNENVISDRKIDLYSRNMISQNFNYIKMSSIEYDEKVYYVLLFKKDAGAYEYPTIHVNWITFKETHYFIFNEEQLSYLKEYISKPRKESYSITINKCGYISSRFKSLGGEHAYNTTVLLSNINNTINNVKNYCNRSATEFYLKSLVDNKKHVIRFRLPMISNSFILRSKGYFELPYKDFKKIINFKKTNILKKKKPIKKKKSFSLELVKKEKIEQCLEKGGTWKFTINGDIECYF
ncbi:hypothetical protein KO488_03375 [Poseidonibacter lekithochrous]|uniref:hypothetical protein n=1 Tax=Poseidonibacter TaxID=2321187 RepID=UPI001C086FA5|nr:MULTISPECIES: hypothetical protein [Poseidonibacter]MBU3013783.1 hypothetical protein [Poseidonibacter lekithochrous]MDO6827080.1 hypothetical protein [Poseidonibacter sp. 1_MG-2023]